MQQLEFDPSPHEVYSGLRDLRQNPYPGRLAIMGLSLDNMHAHIAYALTGRSEGSRKRYSSMKAMAL